MSDSASSVGSSKSASLPGCPDCAGTCTWTAVEFGVSGNPVIWATVPDEVAACGGVTNCRCTLPTRSPDFVGDVQVTACGCCRGCQYFFIGGTYQFWQVDGQNSIACVHPSCVGPCPAPPSQPPPEPDHAPAVVTPCGGAPQ
jgi:hypothetical protein